MRIRFRARACLIVGVCLSLGWGQKEAVMTTRAHGTFDVKLAPQALADTTADATLGRMSADKQYHGDIEGTGKGEMLTAGTSVKDSASYVAIERVSVPSGRMRRRLMRSPARGAKPLAVSLLSPAGTSFASCAARTSGVSRSGPRSWAW